MARARGILDALRSAVEGAGDADLGDLYADTATMEVVLAGDRRSLSGDAPARDLVRRLWSVPAEVPVWRVTPASDGFVVVVERRWREGGLARSSRERHLVWVKADRIARHTILSERPQTLQVLEPDHVPAFVRSLLERCVHREGGGPCGLRDPLAHSGMSGSTLERLVLDDGTAYVVKHVSPATDWIMRATHDAGREAELWRSGALHRIGDVLGTPVVEVEPHGDGAFIVMRDISPSLWGDQRTVTADEIRGLLEVTRAAHERLAETSPNTLCSVEDRYRLLGPEVFTAERRSPDLGPKMAQRSWELFPEVAPPDIVELVTAILDDPLPLANELRARGPTVIHGDLKPDNVGRSPDGFLALDWGLAAWAPPAVEVAWIAVFAFRIELSEDEIYGAFRDVWGRQHDERALALATIGQLAMIGPSYALHIVDGPGEKGRASSAATLRWWVDAARNALDVWAP